MLYFLDQSVQRKIGLFLVIIQPPFSTELLKIQQLFCLNVLGLCAFPPPAAEPTSMSDARADGGRGGAFEAGGHQWRLGTGRRQRQGPEGGPREARRRTVRRVVQSGSNALVTSSDAPVTSSFLLLLVRHLLLGEGR